MKRNLDLPESFWTQDRSIYYFYEEGDPTEKVGGYFRNNGSFTLLTVPKSGHFVPHDNYPVSKAFLDDMTKEHKLQCHDTSTKGCRVNEEMCAAMNNCSGHNGVCMQNGQCQCHSGFKGSDCSYIAWVIPM